MYLKGLLISEHKTLHEQVNMQIHYLRVIMPINYVLMSSIGKSWNYYSLFRNSRLQ